MGLLPQKHVPWGPMCRNSRVFTVRSPCRAPPERPGQLHRENTCDLRRPLQKSHAYRPFQNPPPGRKNHVFLWCFFEQKQRIFTHGFPQAPLTVKTLHFPHPRSTPPAKSGPKTRAELTRENTAFSEGFASRTGKHGVLGPPNTPENTGFLPCAVRNADRT